MEIKRPLQVFKFSPVLVAGAYATGNVMGAPVLIPNAMLDPSGAAIIESLGLQSTVATAVNLEVHFFTALDDANAAPTPGNDKAAFTLSAADMGRWAGMVTLKSNTDYSGTISGGVVAMKGNIKAMLQSTVPTPVTGQRMRSLWAVVVARGAYTAVTASDMQFLLGLEQG